MSNLDTGRLTALTQGDQDEAPRVVVNRVGNVTTGARTTLFTHNIANDANNEQDLVNVLGCKFFVPTSSIEIYLYPCMIDALIYVFRSLSDMSLYI